MSSIMPCEIMNNSQIKPTTPIHLATTSGGGGRGQHPEFSRATELSSLYTMRIEATCLFYVFNRAHMDIYAGEPKRGVRTYRTSRSECVEFAFIGNCFNHLECSVGVM